MAAGSAIFAFVRSFSFSMLEQRFVNNLRKHVYEKFLFQDVEFFDEN